MIFAAGFGTRMGALTADKPKPLVNVAGKPMIDHAISLARAAKIKNITANLHYKHEMLAEHLTPQRVQISRELPEVLDTGGGLRHALPLLGNAPVFTLNPDAVWRGPNPLPLLQQAWNPMKMDGLLMLIQPQNVHGHLGKGDFLSDPEGQLSRGPSMVYSGAQIIKTELLHTIEEKAFSLNKLWDLMLTNDRLYGLIYPGSWCDIGSPEGLKAAENLLGMARV